MTKINCQLIVNSAASLHLQQLYTGFLLLHQQGILELEQVIKKENLIDPTKPQHISDTRKTHLRVILDGTLKLYYDAHDSWEIDPDDLNKVDFYFKRSYCPNTFAQFGSQSAKIIPLGLNYPIYPNTFDLFSLNRNLALSSGIDQLIEVCRSFKLGSRFLFTPRLNLMHTLPDYKARPKVLFMTQTWNPKEQSDFSPEKIAEREQINHTRASCIRLLRKEFGDNFYGGFTHTKFASENYSDCLTPNSTLTFTKNYINFQRDFPIAIATTGLHGSTGWKFAEYIAFSKAIVSEPLNYEAAGNLKPGTNYLVFESPEDCVEQVKRLFCDRDLRTSIMTNNAQYYLSSLKPDILVINTIIAALSKSYR